MNEPSIPRQREHRLVPRRLIPAGSSDAPRARARLARFLRLSFASIVLIAPSVAWSYSFVPTSEEWATWPPYCQAAYASIGYLRTKEFGGQISNAEIEHWQSVLGNSWLGIWHYCAGLAEYGRVNFEPDPQQRLHFLREAHDESLYVYRRLGPKDPLFFEVATLYAQAKYDLGERTEAIGILDDAIEKGPTVDRPYLVLSSLRRRSGDIQGAIDILTQGNASTNFASAEINYALGLLYADRGAYASAMECAKRAYALGYPLPGLKKKLEKAGQWQPDRQN